jgi:N-sulfoglucosamine sulfohydrolase
MIRPFLLVTVLLLATNAPAKETRPSILLFTADDLHAESVGAFRGLPKGLTPRLDRFAAEGMMFDRAHVNVGICAPSRAVIMTGRYSHRSGAMGFMRAREDVPDLVTTLQGAGYLAGILGKVPHSTPKKTMKWDYKFDRGDLGNGRNPTVYYQRSKTFFERCKNEGKPFFFMANSHDPHRPYCNPKKLLKGAALPSRVYTPEEVAVPGFLPDLPGVREELSHYLNSTRRLDDTFGRVLDALEESGAASSTIVLFLSDNGIAVPFAKCNSWFHSTRTPLIVRWPGVVKAGSADRTNFVSGIDFFPTFLEITGVRGPDGLDGRSMVPLLKGGRQESRGHVFTQIDKKAGNDAVPMRCVQNARFGYIYNPFSDGKHRYRNNNEGQCMRAMNQAAESNASIAARVQLFRYRVPEELYDLENDPDSLVNLIDSAKHQDVLKELRGRLESWMRRTHDPMLPAFLHRDDREAVDRVLLKTYGPPKAQRGNRRRNKDKNAKKAK